MKRVAVRPPFLRPAAAARKPGTGRPLDPTTRAVMEPRFGRDFSGVRVHTDNDAAAAAMALQAHAYSVGCDMVFGAGEFAPGTERGQHLLAHELAHVVQPHADEPARIGRGGGASEREADSAADAVVAGGSARPHAARAAVQRAPLPGRAELPPLSGGGHLLDNASPFLAAAAGSTELAGFDTGKASLQPGHQQQLESTARNIQTLLEQYPLSTVNVIGHADSVDTDDKNLALGEARAAAVKQALVDLGIADAIITTETKGEGAPQAVTTPDATPNAKNRRVEVRFDPKRGYQLPPVAPLQVPGKSEPPKPVDIDPRHARDPSAFDNGPRIPYRPPQPDYFKPIPPLPKSPGKSRTPLDMLGEKVLDPIIDAVAGKLPKVVRDKLKEGARDAVKAGVAKSARSAAEAAGITDSDGLDTIENAAKWMIDQKDAPEP